MQQPQKEFNQRATHFTLGSSGQDGTSIYIQDYTRKKADFDSKFQVMDPFKGNSINPPNESSFSTTNKALYKNWGNTQKAALDADKLKDLRTHHFNLGSYNPDQPVTTHNYYYDRKQITSDALKNREESKNRMRAHYHDFKEQPYTNFKSSYNKEFPQKRGEPSSSVKPEGQQNAIVFGNNHLPMVTTNNADYTKKQGMRNQVNNTFQHSSSLVLGDKPQSMETMNQLYYNEKNITKNQLPEATMKQLRATHFNLGGMGTNFQTQTSSNYHRPPQSALNANMGAPNYESGTWVPKDAAFNGSTTSKRQLPARNGDPYKKAEPSVKGGFSLGNQGNNYGTQFSQNFNPKEPVYTGKVKKPQDNVHTGFDKGTYDTEHRSSYINRNLADARNPIDIENICKTDHFHIGGSDPEAHITVYQDQYRRDQQNKSKLFHKDNV